MTRAPRRLGVRAAAALAPLAHALASPAAAVPADAPATAPATRPAVDVADRLARRVTVDYRSKPFGEVLDDLQKHFGQPFRVDREALESAGIDGTTPITLALRDQPLAAALHWVGRSTSWTAAVVFHADAAGVTVTTAGSAAAAAAAKTTTVAHDVRRAIRDANGPDRPDLAELIVDTVLPETWRENGGGIDASVAYDAKGRLVVTHTAAAQEQAAWLLAALGDPANPPAARFAAGDSPARRRALERLAKPLPPVAAAPMTVEEAIARVRDGAGVDVVTNLAAEDGDEAARGKVVPPPAADAAAADVLRAACRASGLPLDFDVDPDGVVVVGSAGPLSELYVLGVHPAPTSGRNAGAKAVERVKKAVRPAQGWADDGGHCTIVAFGRTLIVRAPRRTHAEIAAALRPGP